MANVVLRQGHCKEIIQNRKREKSGKIDGEHKLPSRTDCVALQRLREIRSNFNNRVERERESECCACVAASWSSGRCSGGI